MEPADPDSRVNIETAQMTCSLKGFRTEDREIKIGRYNDCETRIKLLTDKTNTIYEVGKRKLAPMDLYSVIEWHNKAKLIGKINPSNNNLDIDDIYTIEKYATKFYRKHFCTKEELKPIVEKERLRERKI